MENNDKENSESLPVHPDDANPAAESPATNNEVQPQQDQTMEVHHHPKVKKKNFKEYFLEFIMIFLAVTMGFIAENIRENISENAKAREYAENLYQEVKGDSTYMESKLKLRFKKEAEVEYFRQYVLDSNIARVPDRFYNSFAWTFVLTTSIIFEPHDGILNELRSSGSQRYFKSITLQKAIGDINGSLSKIKNRNDQEYSFVEDYIRPFTIQYYDFKWHDNFTQNGKLSMLEAINQPDFHSNRSLVLKNLSGFDREHAESLAAYYLVLIRATRQLYYEDYLRKTHMLLEILRKEYHVEDK